MKKLVAPVVFGALLAISIAAGVYLVTQHKNRGAASAKAPAHLTAAQADGEVSAWAGAKVSAQGATVLATKCAAVDAKGNPTKAPTDRFTCVVAVGGPQGDACVLVQVSATPSTPVRELAGGAIAASYCAGAPGFKP